MLSSSEEYLIALRSGKYLLFLQWPQFIKHHYFNDQENLDADELLTFLVFDWLNNGFCEDDAKALALLNAVYDIESKPIRGTLEYSLMQISAAALNCMVYQQLKLQELFITKEVMTTATIARFMSEHMNAIKKTDLNEQFPVSQQQFTDWSKKFEENTVMAAFSVINPITELRHLLQDYKDFLKVTRTPSDPFSLTRSGIVNILAVYLGEQTELTPEVTNTIVTHVNSIREKKPSTKEEEYFLSRLAPISLVNNTWKYVTSLGMSFFGVLQKSNDEPIVNVSADSLK